MKKGFTLIELLIVVSIIGILAVALIPSLTDAPARARDAGRKAAVNEVVAAVESYNIDNGNYPAGGFCIDGTGTDLLASLMPDAPSFVIATTDSECENTTSKLDYIRYARLADGYMVYVATESKSDYSLNELDVFPVATAADNEKADALAETYSTCTGTCEYAYAVIR